MDEIAKFTYDDFVDSTEPYEYIHQFQNDQFRLIRELEKMSKHANDLKFKNFKKAYQEYVKSLELKSGDIVFSGNVTQFEGQELELDCGQWRADDYGISLYDNRLGEVFACNHPIMPVERLVNIDTGTEKLKLAYRKGKQWKHVIADKKTLAGNNSILALAEVGIGVNSENSRLMVRYLHDIESFNYDRIPEKNSVSRLGWVENEGFSPYVEGLVFDGLDSFRGFFESVTQRGDFSTWLELAREIRKGSVPARVILAASFSSVLVKIIGELSFIVHLWGGTEAGKTVGLMLAASVWADPAMGRYIHTFHGTSVSQELSAGFVGNLPLILDEFQMLKNKKDFEQTVYMLCEGIGKGRGAKSGGLQRTQTWCNCTLSSGEMPITMYNTGGGAVNRIVEVECRERLFSDPRRVADTVRKNYGHAGRLFVEKLMEQEDAEEIRRIYKKFYDEISGSDTTEKQSMAGALILTADRLATRWIFQDGMELGVSDISEFLQTKKEVDVNERAYNFICETVAANVNRFHIGENNEVWGKFEAGTVCIIRSIFGKICEDGGFSDRAVLSWMERRDLIETSVKKGTEKAVPTKLKRIGENPVRCVVMRLPEDELEDYGLLDDDD